MITCPPDMQRSSALATKRQVAAEFVLGRRVVARLIGFSLYLLGGRREAVAEAVGMPRDTFLSFLTRMGRFGVDGLIDRRESRSGTVVAASPSTVELEERPDGLSVCLSPDLGVLLVPTGNTVQRRVVALTLAMNGILSWHKAAEAIATTPTYARALGRKLAEGDVGAILDQRAGQRVDYRVDREKKGRIIAQWAANVATGKPSSGRAVAADLRDSGETIPDRTIRHHMTKLGLTHMAARLSAMVEDIKKGSRP